MHTSPLTAEQSKHTPGPWVVGPVDDTVVTHIGADGVRYEIASIDGDYNQPETWPVMEANARLIAAAPDLLAATMELVAAMRRYEVEVDGDVPSSHIAMMSKADAAIAKAEARS